MEDVVLWKNNEYVIEPINTCETYSLIDSLKIETM